MTLTEQRLAELQSKPEPTLWEQREAKRLAKIVRYQQRYYDRKVERARAEGWCA